MKLAQAVEASQELGAYRVVGALRILIEYRQQTLRVLVQSLHRHHWTLTDAGGGVRYLNGVRREADGSWIVASSDVATLETIIDCFPAMYQHLLAPDCDDWQSLSPSISA